MILTKQSRPDNFESRLSAAPKKYQLTRRRVLPSEPHPPGQAALQTHA
jgi:hypothetical protein